MTRLGALLVLALLCVLTACRGDQAALRVTRLSPPDGAAAVSTIAQLRITFNQQMSQSSPVPPPIISPPVDGQGHWEGNTYVYVPSRPLPQETTFRVQLPIGFQSRSGQALSSPPTWQFRTGKPRVLYLGGEDPNRDQLFVITQDGGEPVQLTRASFGLSEYALSPDGQTIAYAALRQDGGSDLWLVNADGRGAHALLACPGAKCGGLQWYADSRHLAYESRDGTGLDASHSKNPALWWLDTSTGAKSAFLPDGSDPAFNVRWSPDGQWLSYYRTEDDSIWAGSIKDGPSSIIPSGTEEPAVWSGQSGVLLVSQMRFVEERLTVHLVRVDLTTAEMTDLTGDLDNVEDRSAAWSPSGDWIAFTRRPATTFTGAQLWLMRPDGAEAHAITDEPGVHHGAPAWSPDGRQLLYHRLPLEDDAQRPTVWMLDTATGQAKPVADYAKMPAWLP